MICSKNLGPVNSSKVTTPSERALWKRQTIYNFWSKLTCPKSTTRETLVRLTSMNIYPLQPIGLEVTDTLSYLQTTGKTSSLGSCTTVAARRSGGQPHGIAVPGPRDVWVRDGHLAPIPLYTTINCCI